MTLEDIMEAVVRHTNVSEEELKGVKRNGNIVKARYLFYKICRTENILYKEIGAYVGRLHSTVYTAIKNNDCDPKLKVELMEILDELNITGLEIEEIMAKPLWNKNFKIVDISSKYFGECFAGVINDEMICSGGYYEVVNRMLDIDKHP